MLKIVSVPNKVLMTPTQQIVEVTPRIRKLIKQMEDALVAQTDPEGVGLAAPQVGEGLSLFIIKTGKKDKTRVFINPSILKTRNVTTEVTKKKKHAKMEGCLSVPRIWAPLKRPDEVLLAYQDEKGERHEKWFSGFEAIVVQHEVDHLNGVLFTQRCLEKGITLYEEQGDDLVPMKTL